VLFPSKSAPAASDTVDVPVSTYGIYCEQSYISMIGLEICYYGRGAYSSGIYFNNASYNRIDSCNLHHSCIGIGIKRASHFNTIQHCTFQEGNIDTWPWEAVKSGTGYYEAGGVVVFSSDIINRGNTIRFNAFSHLFDGCHLYSETAPTTDMDFNDNTVFSVNDDCIETDGSGINNRIYQNRFRKFLTGVSVAPAATGPTYIFRNLFTGWENHSGYDGYPVKFNVNSSLTIDWVYLYHNTCFTDVANQDGFLFKQYSNWNNVISRNNIYAGTNYALDSWSTQNPVDFDYDNLFTMHSGRLVSWAGTGYTTAAAFSAATAQEAHGLNYAPGFVNVTNNDFTLADSSRLIDKAMLIPGINDSFAGAAPDLGCCEHGFGVRTETTLPAGVLPALSCSPNPFHVSTRPVFRVRGLARAQGETTIDIFNVEGVCVEHLRIAGASEGAAAVWNASAYPGGVYIAKTRIGGTTISTRLVLLR